MRIRDTRQILALASPVRLAIVDALEGIGPCSVATLARILGVAPDSLYYHLRILEKRGLITKQGETIDSVAPSIEVGYETEDAGNRGAVARLAASILRGALRAFVSAFRGPVRVSGKRRELWVGQRTARLTPEQLETVNQLLNELLQTFEHSRSSESEERLYLLTFALSPYGRRK